MHILVAWEIKAEGLRWTQIDDTLCEVLKRYPATKVLPTLHLVRVSNYQDRDSVMRALLRQIETMGNQVELLVSPVMEGRYEGYLPDQIWPSVNAITG